MGAQGHIATEELNDLFKAANLPLPGYRIREIIWDLTATGAQHDGKITFDEFISVSVDELSDQRPPKCLLWSYHKIY